MNGSKWPMCKEEAVGSTPEYTARDLDSSACLNASGLHISLVGE